MSQSRPKTHKGLPTGDIVNALRERDDPLYQWAADVIEHLREEAEEYRRTHPRTK